jgi:phosphatidate cytidylyltransferase
MSALAALESSAYKAHVLIATGLLGGSAATLGLLGRLRVANTASMWRTWRGWIPMVALVVACVGLGRVTTIVGLCVVAVLGFLELARATGLDRERPLLLASCAAIVAAGLAALVPDPTTGAPGWYGLFMALPAFSVAALLAVPACGDRTRGQLRAVALAVLGTVLVGFMFLHAAFLANARHGCAWLLFLVVAVELCDVAAFVAGRALGSPRLCPNVSPNKTWAGSLAAFARGLALPWLLAFSLPGFGPREKVLAGFVVGLGGQLGDLGMSVIKRDLGLKDLGAAIPGHGGILDRIDSLVLAAPLFFHTARFFVGLR